MTVKVANFSQNYGGWATDLRLGPKASFAYSQAFDFRKSPSQMSVLPGLTREDQGTVKDLVLKEVMTNSGTIYGYGDAGYFYKRSTSGVWSVEAKLATGAGGMDYRQDADSIYLTSSKTASLYNQISGTPQFFPDYYGPSFSTYNNSDVMGFNVSAYQAGSVLTTALGSAIIENATTRRFFQTDIEPLVKVSVFVTAKGTGDWTLTLHDGLNNVLGTKTIANASVTTNTWLDFYFTAATNQQVRVYPAPNARTYHVHVTSSNSTGSVSSTSLNDLSTSDLQVWADRFVVTNNHLHPMIRFQQFECFAPGTTVVTSDGVRDIETLAGKTVDVMTPNGYRPAKFRSYGEKRLWEVEFVTGERVVTTKNHQWIVQSGDKTLRVTTDQLEGRKVPRVVPPPPKINDDFYEGLQHGIVYGDGTVYWGTSRVNLYGPKRELRQFFPRSTEHYNDEFTGVYGLPKHYKTDIPYGKSKSYWYGFVAGMVSTDGCVDKRDGCVSISQKRVDILEEIKRELPGLGLVAGEILVSKKVLNGGLQRYHVLNIRKQFIDDSLLVRSDQLASFVANKKEASIYGRWATVRAVRELENTSEVFCCEEPDTNSFVVDNGILTSNCMGNGNYLSLWEPITDVPTNLEWNRHQLTFPQEYEVCGLAVQNEFLVIAAGKTTVRNTSTPQEGVLFFWSGADPNKYDFFIEIPEGTPYALKSYKNVIYYVAGGAWYALTSAQSQPVKIRTLPGSDNEFSGAQTPSITPSVAGVDVFTASGTWVCPGGIYYATVEAYGGGGAGAGVTGNVGNGGGGGGAYASSIVPVVPGASYAVVVGSGGTGSTGAGTAGTSSTFNTSTVVAAPGSGGSGTVGGAGGTTGGSTGDTEFAGGTGGTGSGASVGAGGGGEAGGSTIAGANGGDGLTTGPLSSRAGLGGASASDGGDGGNGGALTAGISGQAPGGGGGGASKSSGASKFGGDGARGEVRISFGDTLATATLIDNFSGTSTTPDTEKWVSFGNYSQANGNLSLTTTPAISFNGINSVGRYDLTGSSMQSRLVDAGNQALVSFEVFPVLGQIDSSNQLYWYVNQGLIKAAKKVAGVNTFISSTTYVANTFQYLRIRENNDVIYYDYSADGVSWTNFTSTARPFAITRLLQVVSASNFGVEASATTAIFDNYNVIVASDYAVGYPDMMTVRRGVLMLGYPAITSNPATNYGVYGWGSVDVNYKPSFGYSYLLSTGDKNFSSTNNLQIGMVKSFGDLMHVSWRDDLVSGTPRYGIDKVDNSSFPAPTAIWDSLIITNSYTAKFKAGYFVEAYYDVPEGATITLAYSINQGDWVYDTVSYTSTTLWQGQVGYARFNITDANGGRFRELQGRITVTSGNSVTRPAVVQEVDIAYDSLDKEQVQ